MVQASERFQRIGRFLKTQARTVNQTDHRRTHLHCHIVNVRNLSCMHLAYRAL